MADQKWCLSCDEPTAPDAYRCANCGNGQFAQVSKSAFLNLMPGESDAAGFACSECGKDLIAGQKFCANCGVEIEWTVEELKTAILTELEGSRKGMSTRKKFFLGGWALINFIYVVQLIESAVTPVDRFRSVCNWAYVTCGPSAQDKFNNALGNLLLWNLIFLGIWLYKRRKAR